MIDPRQWCSACGLHVASEHTAPLPTAGAPRLLCPACADDPDQRLFNEAASMLADLHEIERQRVRQSLRVGGTGRATMHVMPATTSRAPTPRELMAGYDLTTSMVTVQHRGGDTPRASYDGGRTWHPLPVSAVGPFTTEEIRGQVDSGWPYSTAGRLGGYPYMPRLHAPRDGD
jgi:hypothetical protein